MIKFMVAIKQDSKTKTNSKIKKKNITLHKNEPKSFLIITLINTHLIIRNQDPSNKSSNNIETYEYFSKP